MLVGSEQIQVSSLAKAGSVSRLSSTFPQRSQVSAQTLLHVLVALVCLLPVLDLTTLLLASNVEVGCSICVGSIHLAGTTGLDQRLGLLPGR